MRQFHPLRKSRFRFRAGKLWRECAAGGECCRRASEHFRAERNECSAGASAACCGRHDAESPCRSADGNCAGCVTPDRIAGGESGVGGKGKNAGGGASEKRFEESGGGAAGEESWEGTDERAIGAGARCAGSFRFRSTGCAGKITERGAADLSAGCHEELHHGRRANRSGSGQAGAYRGNEDFAGAEAVPAGGDGRAEAV